MTKLRASYHLARPICNLYSANWVLFLDGLLALNDPVYLRSVANLGFTMTLTIASSYFPCLSTHQIDSIIVDFSNSDTAQNQCGFQNKER